ncbi:monocarboxylate transporter 9 isoform X1 [Lasioglossum baleicum]|uniref:monocarboxylate transporter 9 isoform X1 n=1 Tax=Lasioglossum baleicum TaxID=434251 RepID=UPI003FCD009E
MAEWYRVKFNDERKLTESSETIDPPEEGMKDDCYSGTTESRSDLNNGEIPCRKHNEESAIEKRRSSSIASQNTPREAKHHKSRDAASIVLNSIAKDDSRFQTNSDQIGILSEELSKSLSNQSYENDVTIDKFEDEEERRCLEKTYNGYEDPGSRIREEARQELKKLSKRPVNMQKEDVSGSQKRKNLVTVRRSISPTRILSAKRRLPSEKSIEKLVNGSSSREDKQQHHVQFNKDSKKQYSRDERSQPTPSIPTSAISTSEDNSSLGQLCEGTPPDGGWGWVVVVAAFIINLIGDGVTFSFGVIYVEFLKYFDEGKFKTAWIGSIFMAMPLLCGPVASFLTDRYGCRRVCIAGSILATTGFVITSFANSMAVLVFTFGILPGFGLSLCFVTAVVIVAYYFDKKRSFATGLSGCGSGIGTFICAPFTQYLLDEYGWRGTTLILAGLFLQLAVCGCLMRDPEWTTTRARAKTEERRKNREKKRSRIQSSSMDSFSANCSLNTLTIMEKLRLQGEDDEEKLFSSLLSLPTFVNTGEKVPSEVLELLSTRKNVYNVLVQNYPNLLIPSRRLSDSGALHEQLCLPSSARLAITPPSFSELKTEESKDKTSLTDNQTIEQQADDAWRLWWSKKISLQNSTLRRSSTPEHSKRIPPGFPKDIRMHKRSLTYRGAMLNMNRLRASSCPDIYRNSMTTRTKTKLVWCAGLWDILLDMVDFSHFADSRFLLFAISNFLLHTWYDVPYVYLTDNAIEMGFSETDASNLISVIGITNTVGEVLLGWAGDRAWLNASIVYAVCMAFCGAVTALIPKVVRNYYLLCVISGAFGLFISANCSLTSIILVELITLERFANAYGLLLLVQGVANLVGPPLAGWLYDITGKYDLSFYLAGLCIALSGVLLLAMPLISLYRKCVYGSKKEETDKEFSSLNSVYISRGSSRSIQNEGKL